MAILRNPNKDKFTIVDNTALKDKNLSLKARGLLITMLSLPDNWDFSEKGLCAILEKDGQSSIRSGLKELEEYGYLVRTRERDQHGKISNVAWTIYDYPHLENPSMVNPSLDNRLQLNTKRSSTDESRNKEYISAKPKRNRAEYSELFERFWSAYPKKVAKGTAAKAFKKAKVDESLLQDILKALEWQRETKQWKAEGGQYIPNPATYLNGRRWEDEQEEQPNGTNDISGTCEYKLDVLRL